MSRTFLLFIVFSVMLLWSCKERNKEQHQKEIVTEIPEDFVSFYEKFHTDTIFQIQHILFPLEGMPSLDSNMDLDGFSFWWEKDGWKLHKPFDDAGGTFQRHFDNFAGIITETIVDNSGQFSMVRRFSKMDDEWMLIYYKQMGKN